MQRNYMGLVSEVRTLGAIASPNDKNVPLIRFVLLNKTEKAVLMLNNRNMFISILQINRKSIITQLNKLPYLSNSRHLKSRNGDIVVKLLMVKYVLQISSTLGTMKYIGVKSCTTRQWFSWHPWLTAHPPPSG